MTTLTRQHTQETKDTIKNDELFKELSQELEEAFQKECWYLKEKKAFEKIRSLVKQPLTDMTLIGIIRPWVRGIQLAYILDNIDIPTEKQEAIAISDAIKTIKKYLSKKTPARDKIRYITESKLFDYTLAHQALDNINEHALFFINQVFKNGAELNSNYLKRYAVYSLFYIGKKLGLKKLGQPSQLYQFIKIITDLDNRAVSEYFAGFSKTTIQKEVSKNNLLRFIFDPITTTT